MTERENEFENTGGNHPDQGGADAEAMKGTAAASPADRDPANPVTGPEGEEAAAAEARGNVSDAEREAEPVDGSAAPAADPTHEAVGIGVVPDVPDHHGQDEGRDTLTASQSQSDLSGAQEQRLPAMAQNNAPDVDKVAGIVAQTRSDVATEPHERIVEVLHQRLEQSGIHLPDDEISELARQVSTG